MLVARHGRGEIHHCEWRELLELVKDRGGCDAVIFDGPYSAATHKGHNIAAKTGKRARRAINYACWSPGDAASFVNEWHSWCRMWMVSLTDDTLAPHYRAAMALNGRKTFAPLPCVELNNTVRQRGDGPANWASWGVVGRPRSKQAAAWGALPGAYVVQSQRGKLAVGGKSLELMRAIVRDYTRPGDLVVDPTCGEGGTTLVAALLEGRIALGCDVRREAAESAARELERAADAVRPVPAIPDKLGTLPLFGGIEQTGPRLVGPDGVPLERASSSSREVR